MSSPSLPPPLTHVVWDDALTGYDFGAEHPMAPRRLELTASLCRDLGLFDHDDVEVVAAPVASDEDLLRAHRPEYLEAVRAASADPASADPAFGIGTEDDPAFAGMHDAAARLVGGTLEVTKAVWEGRARHGVNFTGGMHHAMPGKAAGFCIYNDAAVAIAWALENGAERVAYVDIDVHHGDGVEACFWDDPRVLTVSVHETGRVLFPGTGFAKDTGGAVGTAVNCALPPGTSDAAWLRAIDAVTMPVVRAFAPDLLITQHGCDSHFRDPLAHLAVSIDGQRQAFEMLHRLSHEVSGGRWVSLGGGGYEVVDVVPRAWAHLTGIASHHPVRLETPTPQSWRDHVERTTGRPAPTEMNDGVADGGVVWWRGWQSGHNPNDAVDAAIMATRSATFPQHGLDEWFD